jgi:hypothetical protein
MVDPCTDVAQVRPQATQMIDEYEKTQLPVIQHFLKKVTESGRTHLDFVPILAKYNLKPAAETGTSPTTVAPLSGLPLEK